MANPTLQDVIDEARGVLQDTRPANYRYTTETLLRAANLYLFTMRRDQPDLFFGSYAAPLAELTEGDDFPLGWQYVLRGAHWVVGNKDLWEADHAESGRAGAMFALGARPSREK